MRDEGSKGLTMGRPHEPLYVIEARDGKGALKFDTPQPEEFFGLRAITGITDNEMSSRIFRSLPSAVLDGRFLLEWPRLLNPCWAARRKTW